jgi:hypothetical protein
VISGAYLLMWYSQRCGGLGGVISGGCGGVSRSAAGFSDVECRVVTSWCVRGVSEIGVRWGEAEVR